VRRRNHDIAEKEKGGAVLFSRREGFHCRGRGRPALTKHGTDVARREIKGEADASLGISQGATSKKGRELRQKGRKSFEREWGGGAVMSAISRRKEKKKVEKVVVMRGLRGSCKQHRKYITPVRTGVGF